MSLARFAFLALAAFSSVHLSSAKLTQAADDGKLRIVVFGAHPDDAEIVAGGCGAKWAKLGHHVLLCSVTNGDIGHWQMAGGPLADRRTAEVAACSKILGTTSKVLDIHDGELEPTLENRKKIIRVIRDWRADVVISHRPWDYHPDHRYVGVLVQDAAYMVTVPFICPDTPILTNNPVFMYSGDRFQKPYPFKADVAVSIDDVLDQKIDALHELASQHYEGGANGSEAKMRSVPPAKDVAGRKDWLRKYSWFARSGGDANRFRADLISYYGEEKGKAVKNAECFEICEYGRQPTREELKKLFPFFE